MRKIKFIFFFILSLSHIVIGQDTTAINQYRLGFFDLTLGTDSRFNSLNEWSTYYIKNQNSKRIDTTQMLSAESKQSFYQGIFFRIQTSFLATYLKYKNKRFTWGDLISVEISGGYSASNSAIKSDFRTLYNCEFGLFGSYRFSPNTEIGMSLAMLKFYRDYLSDFYGGSNYYIKFRHKRVMGEIGYESINKLYFGVFNFIVKGSNVDRISFGIKYFVKPTRIVGIRYDATPLIQTFYNSAGQESLHSIKLFYGINF